GAHGGPRRDDRVVPRPRRDREGAAAAPGPGREAVRPAQQRAEHRARAQGRARGGRVADGPQPPDGPGERRQGGLLPRPVRSPPPMSYTDNRTILQKADLALADLTAGGGLLKPAQAQKFMRLLIKYSPLMRLATVVPMQSPKQQLSKIKFGSRVLRPGAEVTA